MVNRTRPKSDRSLSRAAESKLIAALQRGEQSAARPLIESYKQRLFAFVWRIVPNAQDAEDICQEAFLRACCSIDTFDSRYRFSTWLYTIAYRLCLNLIRRRQPAGCGTFDVAQLAGHDRAASGLAESEEARRLKREVWGAVEKLSPPQRAAIILFYREAQSCQEIAEVLEVPVATVKSHLYRARTRLKELLEPVFAGDWGKLSVLNEVVA